MNTIVCFGEPLLRLSPSLGGGWIRDGVMASYVGGAELNVARALSLWGMSVRYAAALPMNGLGDDIVDHMNDVLIDEILDWCVHQAQETLQEEVEDYRNLVLTDEHGQHLYTHIKKKSKKSKKKGKTKK